MILLKKLIFYIYFTFLVIYYLHLVIFYNISVALSSFLCADVLLSNYSLTTMRQILPSKEQQVMCYIFNVYECVILIHLHSGVMGNIQ